MALSWLYQIPTLWMGVLVVGFFLAVSVAGLLITRPWRRKLVHADNDFANYYVATVAVIYAVLIGLIAAASWGDFSAVEDVVSQEANAVSSIYRNAEVYPPEVRAKIRGLLREYVSHVIDEEWKTQRRGVVPKNHNLLVRRIGQELVHFEPRTPGQQAVHLASLRELDEFLANRRLRLEAVRSNLPGLMWAVLLAGGVLTVMMTFFFWSDSSRMHVVLNMALAMTIGLVIFLILALDRPLVGSVSVQPTVFQEVLEMMAEGG
ncbi:MAG: DUF4239 domain-containing protein [Thermoanaerobaculia bacterium]